MCSQHTKLIYGVEVKESTNPEWGLGLFATRDLPEGSKIPYTAKLLSLSQLNALYGMAKNDIGLYVYKFAEDLYLDAGCVRGVGSFANHDPKHKNAKFAPNHRKHTLSIVATRNIKANEEILVSYSRNYFPRANNLPKPEYKTLPRKVPLSKVTPIPAPIPLYVKPLKPRPVREAPEFKYDESFARDSSTLWESGRLTVGKSTIPNAGNGLFSAVPIRQGDIITCIEKPVASTEEEAEESGFPHDSVYFFDYKPNRGKVMRLSVFDASWTDPNSPAPLWYYMNHSRKLANAKPIQVMTKYGPSICWKAKFDIPANEEIMFDYTPGKRVEF
jgi:hypothetical protein